MNEHTCGWASLAGLFMAGCLGVEPPTEGGAAALEPNWATEALADVDGDGEEEILVTHRNFCGSGGCAWELLLSSGLAAGRFDGFPHPLPTAHEGRRDLRAYFSGGCAGLAGTFTYYEFDGRSYVPARHDPVTLEALPAQVQCGCPWWEPDAPRAPECPPAADGPSSR